MMNVDEYQKLALRTAPKNLTRGDEMLNGLMGLNGEAGEAIDICFNSSTCVNRLNDGQLKETSLTHFWKGILE